MAMPARGEKIRKGGLKGVVFNIQRFSVHDGPGMRTTVFLKGCPLKCAWCANPESQELLPQLMLRDVKCVACGSCAQACPRQAISLTKKQGRRVNWRACNQCLKCTDVCLYEALGAIGKYMDIAEIVQEVERDRIFYLNSGGGVTLSGGEPLAQYDVALKLLQTFKANGLHTALDTCGYASEEIFEEILPYVDLVLFDIKQLDAEQHRKYTGVDNERILRIARFVSQKVRTWLRVPLIEGFNDSPEDIRGMSRMARELGVEKISLLPYHEGGRSKSLQIGKIYRMPRAKPPGEEHIQRLQEIASEMGVTATVGI